MRIRTVDAPPRIDHVKGWTIRVEPAEITAAVGDHVAVAVHLMPLAEGLGTPEFSSLGTWLQPNAEHLREVSTVKGMRTKIVARAHDGGFVLAGVVLVGPSTPTLELPVTFVGRQQPGSLAHVTVKGPAIVLDRTTPSEALAIVSEPVAHQRAERWVTVDVAGRTLTVVVAFAPQVVIAKGRSFEIDCDFADPKIDWSVRRIDGRLTAIAFVERRVSDECSGPTGITDRRSRAVRTTLTARTHEAIEVVFYRVCSSCRRTGIVRTAFAFELP